MVACGGSPGSYWSHNMAVTPDGGTLYVAVEYGLETFHISLPFLVTHQLCALLSGRPRTILGCHLWMGLLSSGYTGWQALRSTAPESVLT